MQRRGEGNSSVDVDAGIVVALDDTGVGPCTREIGGRGRRNAEYAEEDGGDKTFIAKHDDHP